ncbi:MAG: cardiolipin synthase [Elusimicrobiota bacterium]|jgi:cardiolipin synthase|nr:cardiolipin synthase [Elusimicrobiota bacterium]
MDFLLDFLPISARNVFSTILAVLYICLSAGAAIHILLYKNDVKGSIGWLALVFFSPFLGVIAYIIFGINRVRRKAARLRKRQDNSIPSYFEIQNLYSNERVNQFITFGRKVYYQELTFKNSIEHLINGTQAYPAMLAAIKSARQEVIIESYIFDVDGETDKFIEAFKIALSNGAKVRVLIDGIGSMNIFRRTIEKTLKSIKGLEYAVFLPPNIPIAFPFLNLRNHRKLMVIDGQTAFFGGMNLSKDNTLVEDKKRGVLDITFKIEGPVIEQISQMFEEDWEFASGKQIDAVPYQERQSHNGNFCSRIVPAGPDTAVNEIELMVCGGINFASKKITVLTPYFLPEDNILTALEMAAMRGVDVEIILPQRSDHLIMRWAEKPNFLRLIAKGVRIYRTPRPFDHSKLFIVDNFWSFVGSANWDVRSFKLHFEANMEVFSEEFAEKLSAIAEEKKSRAHLVSLSECLNINIFKKMRNNLFRLITPYY